MIESKIKVKLSKDLRKKYGIKSFPIATGDIVSVRKGPKKDEGGKVLRVNHVKRKILIDGITIAKADNKHKEFLVDPSMMEITKIDTSLKGRLDKLKERAANRDIVIEEEPVEETKEEAVDAGELTETTEAEEVTEAAPEKEEEKDDYKQD